MIRRYDMHRSDNFPVCSTLELLCMETEGRIFVMTGFPVKSAIVTPVKIPQDSELSVDTEFNQPDGFYVIYSNMPKNSVIKFSYQAV